MKKIFFTFLFVLSMGAGFPQLVHADACADLKAQFANANAGNLAAQFPQYCSEGKVYDKVVNIMYMLIGIFAVIILIYGGYVYMLAQGNAAQAAKGRQILTWAIAGFVVVILATVIVNVVVRALQ